MNRRKFTTCLAATGLCPTLLHAGTPKWVKHGELFRHTGKPTGGWIQNFTSPAEPLENDRWRLWISLSGIGVDRKIGFAEGSIGGKWDITYANAGPGLILEGMPPGWHPVQPVHLVLKDGTHRLYFWVHGDSDGHVVRFIAADSDDGVRYRVVNALQPCLYHISDRAVGAEARLDIDLPKPGKKMNLTDGESPAPAHLICNDATNVYQLPDGTFELFTVGLIPSGRDKQRDGLRGMIRVIYRYTSADGLLWNGPQKVIIPDSKDPGDLEFYYLSVTYTDKGRIGILGRYRTDAQTIDMECCNSTDGVNWERNHREPWIDRGGESELDRFMIYPPHQLIFRDGKWWMFYTGANFSHDLRDFNGQKQRGIFAATLDALIH